MVEKVKDNEFQLTMFASGHFDIPITINFNKSTGLQPMKINHTLTLKEPGKWKTINAGID